MTRLDNGTLVLIGGPAGAGKSHVSRLLAHRIAGVVVLDKDTLTSPLTERLLVELRHPPEDRDSAAYQAHVRPLEYATLMEAAFENVGPAKVVLAVAPFARELEDPQWISAVRDRAAASGVRTGLIWIIADCAVTRARVMRRNAPRDTWKLANWAAYQAGIRFALPVAAESGLDHIVVHNLHEAQLAGEIARAVAFVKEMSARATPAA